MLVYWLLFFEFLKIGLFSVGGGYGALPFLYTISQNHNWYSAKELNEMLIISNITPGPVGINMAVFAGYKAGHMIGSVTAILGIILPALIVTAILIKFLDHFEENKYVKSVLNSLAPTACAMISAIGIKLFALEIFNLPKLNELNSYNSAHFDSLCFIILIVLFVLSKKKKLNPILIMLISGIAGCIIASMFNIQL